MAFVEFVFSSIWNWLGFFLLIYIPIHEICNVIRAKLKIKALQTMLSGITDTEYLKELIEDERKECKKK